MQIMERNFKHNFSKGANERVIKEAADFVAKGGDLSQVAKTHFKTMKEVEKILKKA